MKLALSLRIIVTTTITVGDWFVGYLTTLYQLEDVQHNVAIYFTSSLLT